MTTPGPHLHVLVTGGAGFIGANLVRAVVDAGHRCTVLDDLSTGSLDNLVEVDATIVEGSVLDVAVVEEAAAEVDAIIHLAARPSVPRSIEDPLASHEVNVTGTLNVLEAARARSTHVVLASSSSVYGANPTLPKSEGLRPEPMSPYAVSKLAAEQYALAYAACYGLPALPFRFFNVYGPLQPPGHAYAAVVPAFVDAALDGRPLPLHGDGEQSRDFTFVDDVTQLLLAAVVRRVTSTEPVNLAFGGRHTLRELIATIERLLGREVQVDKLPRRAGDVRHSQADSQRLTELFPDIRPVPFEDGIRATIDWFLRRRPAA
jgi:UDP-glucose 4-epimerase